MLSISSGETMEGELLLPTRPTTLGRLSTFIRSRKGRRTKIYPGKSGISRVTRRSFHWRTERQQGRKCSTWKLSKRWAVIFSWLARTNNTNQFGELRSNNDACNKGDTRFRGRTEP